MYTEFYNLKEKPFTLSPSSRFLYLGEVHKEALALLTYGVAERKGFTLLTGEVGTGKTTMINALLEKLGETTYCVHLSNPLLSANDFMNYLAASVFDSKIVFKSKTDFLIEFENFLKKCLQQQRNVILIVDEAHTLSFELLEEVRLLSNMETADEKLINIFLAGQPELNEKLSRPQCRALLQRINTRYHIRPLDQNSTREYILKRLGMAGAKNKIFSKNVINAIYQYSKGYPRMINILADNVLLLGYSRGKKNISHSMVKECYEDLQLEGSFPKNHSPKLSDSEVKEQKGFKFIGPLKWATVLMFILAALVVANSWYGEQRLSASADTLAKERILAKENIIQRIQAAETYHLNTNKAQGPIGESTNKTPEEHQSTSLVTQKDLGFNETKQEPAPQDKTIIVKEGENLITLALKIYGQTNKKTLDLIQEHNPEIKDINNIAIGQEIIFPLVSTSDNGRTFTVHIASCKPFKNARKLFLELLEQSHEAYLIPVHSARKGKFFRISLGNFKSSQAANIYAKEILRNKVSDYAQVIRLEMR